MLKRHLSEILPPSSLTADACHDAHRVCTILLCVEGALSGLRQFLATESLLKGMKNVFYFALKALFVLKIFKFLFDFLVIYKNGFIRKITFSKLMMSQPG